MGPPVAPRGRLLLLQRIDEATAIVSEAGALYGEPIEEFTRLWIQAGPNALFVVDRIRACRPVRTVWNWLLNNGGGASEFELRGGHTLIMRRGLAGVMLAHGSEGRLGGPVHAVMHDAYHPEPDKQGEGRSGSGMLYRWTEPQARTARLAVHAVGVDDYGLIADWWADRQGADYQLTRGRQCWTLTVSQDGPLDCVLYGRHVQRKWRLLEKSGGFQFLEDTKESRP